ncbi:magnesium and cobalt transport protein CorA [Pseudonocardia pini]|uniref:magnesium and cobalt transport protein CorA n=1 Tax=Pseudonocardia pini TaxID=2758030 RepID=UPI0015F001D3|nr:magnesium and cobalt transport protein CorA [Pseudonocardia pini]
MTVVDNAVYVDGRRSREPESLDQTVETLAQCGSQRSAFCWIGMLRPTEADIAEVEKEFGLHELAVEDTLHGHQRPKLERYGDTDFVVLRPARYLDDREEVELGEIHLFLGPWFVVTVRHAEEPDLSAVRQRLENDPELLSHGPFAVFYGVLDKIVDDYGPVLDGLQDDVDQIESQVWGGDPAVSQRIYELSREVIEFQRAVDPLAEIFEELRLRLSKKSDDPDLELHRLFRDVNDHATRVRERTQGLRDLLANILTVNSTLVAQRQNEEMTRLTEAGYVQNEQMKKVSSWAAIAFAPTLIAGIYGMNFEHMPELGWALGYPFAVGLMVGLAGLLYVIFKRRGWL